MACTPLLRQRLLPLAGLTAGLALVPIKSTHAEEPVEDPIKTIRIRKPIYDAPPEPTPREIAATTPPPASGITEKPQEEHAAPTSNISAPRRPSPTDRLAGEIKRVRLGLHDYAVKTEDAVNRGMDRFMSAEHSFTSTIASLAPPKESNEKLMPGSIYVLVAAMAGSIISRNRNILIRFVTPIVTGVTTAHYVIPRTTENVSNLVWEYEKKYPVIADNHLAAQARVKRFMETGKAHSQMGWAMAEEKVIGVREAVEEWVKKGR
ncbi:Component of the MICOS complex [Teratosphaeria destructans]|uniref:MICOS complex subunit n=1 Tax=Teratosphaeria destructans TaxID=418781 RepID=A0A9W7W3J7_9PEZI|nr:Component of the MICOS complex [Teratosphaeria destructans]